MSLFEHKTYVLNIMGKSKFIKGFPNIKNSILHLLDSSHDNEIYLSGDNHQQPWWDKFLSGHELDYRTYFTLHWSQGAAFLIFYDVTESEYIALSQEEISVDENTRKKISYDEEVPLELKYCIPFSTAKKAIEAFLETGQRPDWFQYEFNE